MKMRAALLALPLLLAACGGGAGDAGNGATPAAPVASVAPPAGKSWTDVVSKTADGGFVQGNPSAPIKLVEYGSRTCPTCGAFGQTATTALEDRYIKTGKVSYEFRDFLIHAPDLGVATVGRCAGAEPFFGILHQMYVDQPTFLAKLETVPADFQQRLQSQTPAQQATAWVDYMGYVDWLKQRGVPEQQIRQCLADGQAMEALGKITEVASGEKGVTGTPSFFLNGGKLDAITWADVEQALKGAGA